MLNKFLLQMTVNNEAAAQISEELIPEEKTLTIWELVSSGGIGGAIIMLTLLVLSIIAVYIIIERFLAIKKASKEDANLMNQVKDFILDGKIDAAKTICASNNSLQPAEPLLDMSLVSIEKESDADVDSAIVVAFA